GLLMGWIGTSALAAHQIALQIASIMFMVPFGISMAATVRAGHAVGRRDSAGTRSAGFVAIWLGIAFMTAMTLLVIATREMLPILFLGTATEQNAPTLALAATLLVVGASFFIADGVQTVAQGALRGLNDTASPMLYSFICFWIFAFPASYLLGFPLGLGAVGIWIALSVSLILYSAMLILRFHRLTKRGYLPDVPKAI
ncbi:MAG: MATE family efflux transporter, partial [Pseudorhodoplanes sp.]